MPTIVASGQSSWTTRKVVMDEWGQAGPLNIGEMEAAMEYDVGYTEAEALSMCSRFKLIGNAFHAGMLRHLLLCFVSDAALKGVLLRDGVRQKGVPFTERDDAVAEDADCSATKFGGNGNFQNNSKNIYKKLVKIRLQIPVPSVQNPSRVRVAVASCRAHS